MDRAVQKTDDDAASSKLSAASRGYFSDKFLPSLYPHPAPQRLPLINTGTYCRVFGIHKLVAEFLSRTESHPERAIVSLGAGSDTRAFHLLPEHNKLHYYEIDFPTKVEAKRNLIAKNRELRAVVENADNRYHLIGCDLRDLSRSADPLSTFDSLAPLRQLDHRATLILSECCLCYLQPEYSDGVLKFFADLVPPKLLSVVIYEPISLNDEFGRVMTENLAMRGLSLPTVSLYATLFSQKKRLVKLLGSRTVGAEDMQSVYKTWLSEEDLRRVSKLELLDEVEEMFLLMRHYCVAWGYTQ